MIDNYREKSSEELLNEGIRSDTDALFLQLQELYKNERLVFIRNAAQVINEAIGLDIAQQANIETLPNNIFKHYTLFYFAQEQTAQEGDKFKPTIGIKLTERLDKHGRPAGDEMQLRIAIPDDLTISEHTDPELIETWLDNVSEVYVCYKSGKRFKRKAAMYRIMPEGFQHYSPLEDESRIDLDQELLNFIGNAQNQTKMTFKNAYIIFDLLAKLGYFKGVPLRTTKL